MTNSETPNPETPNPTAKECLKTLLKAFKETLNKAEENSKYIHSSCLSNIKVNLKALETALAGNSCLDQVEIKPEEYQRLVKELLKQDWNSDFPENY